MITTQVLKLARHIIRMEDNRCDKTVISWVPLNGKRKRGRPRLKWKRAFKNDLATGWDGMKQQHWPRTEMHRKCFLLDVQ